VNATNEDIHKSADDTKTKSEFKENTNVVSNEVRVNVISKQHSFGEIYKKKIFLQM